MENKYVLYEPETEEEQLEFTKATFEMDTLLDRLKAGEIVYPDEFEAWKKKFMDLGSDDTAVHDKINQLLNQIFQENESYWQS